jgi:hypothetical protein
MVVLSVSVHPQGLSPASAAKAWYLKTKQGFSWPEVQAEVSNVDGSVAGIQAIRNAVARMSQISKIDRRSRSLAAFSSTDEETLRATNVLC